MIKEQLRTLLKQSVLKLDPQFSGELELSVPSNSQFGDFASNIALMLAGKLGKKPREIAETVQSSIEDTQHIIESISIAGPGFINFKLNPVKWIESFREVALKGDQFGHSTRYSGQKVLVELVSANPTGPLHVGNARGGPLGDVIASLLSQVGYEVTREYYLNDVGGQIDKLGQSILHWIQNMNNPDAPPPDGYQGEYVKELAQKYIASGKGTLDTANLSANVHALGEFGMAEMVKSIKSDCADMGIHFDSWIQEKDILGSGETAKTLLDLKNKNITLEKDGAVWLATQDEFLQDRECVLERSDGRPTYFANDIAYHVLRYKRKYDRMINVWGSNHHGHVPRIKAALNALGYDPSKLETVLYQYVRVKRGKEAIKMSKRGGNFVLAREVLDEVGKDAFRFLLLLRSPEAHLDFDLELATSQNSENPVYYVQYAHARICSIFFKAQEEGKSNGRWPEYDEKFTTLLNLPEEIDLARFLLGYPELVEKAAADLAPHRVAHYVLELARHFQSYYDKARSDSRYRVLSGDEQTVRAKLFLLGCIRQVLRNALSLLGVSAPEKM